MLASVGLSDDQFKKLKAEAILEMTVDELDTEFGKIVKRNNSKPVTWKPLATHVKSTQDIILMMKER